MENDEDKFFKAVMNEVRYIIEDEFHVFGQNIHADVNRNIRHEMNRFTDSFIAKVDSKFMMLENLYRDKLNAIVQETERKVKEMEEKVSLAVMMSASDEFGMF